jgi:hypothetical protein
VMDTDPLREGLRRLARALERDSIELIVDGGYGLLLRTEQIRLSGVRTRFSEVPGARSTNDLDIFLGLEIITNAQKAALIRTAFDNLGYKPIKGAEFYQFVLPIEYAGIPRGIKIDLLAAPVLGENRSKVSQDSRRLRPRTMGQTPSVKLHAHTTPEALTVEEHTLPINISDTATALIVHIPHPFSYLLMKLFALRDRLGDDAKGPYHAFDIYRTIAMMTAGEWREALAMRDEHRASEIVREAGSICRALFADSESPGTLRLRDYARTIGEHISPDNLRGVVGDLDELLSPRDIG